MLMLKKNGTAPGEAAFTYEVEDEETLEVTEETATIKDYNEAVATDGEV